jgi:hypothetical protein
MGTDGSAAHPHAAFRAVHGARVDCRVAAVLARDARPTGYHPGSRRDRKPEGLAALQDVPEQPPQEAPGDSVRVATGTPATPADDAPDDQVAG